LFRLKELGTCCDGMAEPTNIRYSTGTNHFGITLSRKLLVCRIRNTKYFQYTSRNFRGVCLLEAFFDVAISSVYEQEVLSRRLLVCSTPHGINATCFRLSSFLRGRFSVSFARSMSLSSCSITDRAILLFGPQNSRLAVPWLISCHGSARCYF
jgi:hypothetical protein